MSGEKRKPQAVRQVPLVEFASYTRSLLRSLATSAEKFKEPGLASLLEAAAAEAARIEKRARSMEN